MLLETKLVGLIDGAFSKISAFRPQGPQFDPRLCQNLNIGAAFISG